MLRRDLAAPLLFVLVAALCAYGVRASGRSFLPRHPAATPPEAGALPYVPYGGDGAASRAAAEPFNFSATDPVNLLGPDLDVAARALRAGAPPLWNADVLCGVPHAANPITAALYPPTWLVAALPPRDAPLVFAALHVALAAVLAYAWLRALALGPFASAFGAFGFAASGWFAGRLFNFVVVDVVVWLPLGFLGLERVAAGRPKSGAAALAAAVALMFLAGFPQLAVLGTLALGVYAAAIVAAALRDGPRAAARTGAAALVGVLAGAALAAPLLLPAAELRAVSARGNDAAAADRGVRPGAFLGLLAPTTLGGPYDRPAAFAPNGEPAHAARNLAARLLVGDVGLDGVALVGPTTPNASELAVYPGAAALILLVAAAGRRRLRPVLALAAIGVLGAAYATRALAPPPLLARILGLDFGAAVRGVVVCAFVPAALAACAVQAALDAARPTRLVLCALCGAAPLAAAASWGLADADGFDLRVVRALVDAGAERLLGAPPGGDPAGYAALLRPALDAFRADLARAAAAAVAACAGLALARRGAARPVLRATGLTILFLSLAVDLALLGTAWVKPVRAADPYPASPALRALAERLGEHRFARLSADDAEAAADVDRLFPPNCGLVHGLRDAQGYREPAPRRTLDWFRGSAARVASAGVSGFGLAAAGGVVPDLAGIRYFVAGRPLDAAPDFAAAGLVRVPLAPAVDGDLVLYENRDALPRAFLVDAGTDVASRPASRPVVRGEPLAAARPRPERAEFRVRAESPAVFVWTEAFDRGWTVRVDDGDAGPPDVAYGLFQSVRLAPGEHAVVFEYLPYGWRTGRIVLPVAAAAVVGLWIVARRRRMRAAAAPPAPGAAP